MQIINFKIVIILVQLLHCTTSISEVILKMDTLLHFLTVCNSVCIYMQKSGASLSFQDSVDVQIAFILLVKL